MNKLNYTNLFYGTLNSFDTILVIYFNLHSCKNSSPKWLISMYGNVSEIHGVIFYYI